MIKNRRLRWGGLVVRMEDYRCDFKISTRKPRGNIPSGMPRRRWEDNIKMDLKEIGISRRC